MKFTLKHLYSAPYETGDFNHDYPMREAITWQLTDHEQAIWGELRHARICERLGARITDTADPLKRMILDRKPSKEMRLRRAAMMGCADWQRGPSGQLQGQLILNL